MKNDRKSLKIIAKSGHGTKKTLKNVEKSIKIVGPGTLGSENMREICAKYARNCSLGASPALDFLDFGNFGLFY